jgi:cation diffusion facilitator CzcD-associated flavoprotein CzcO
MLEWLIVGGGIHGTHLAHVLLAGRGVARDRLAVLDPHPTPLHRWRECTRAVGMRYLRSPSVHHIGLDPFDLVEFARAWPRGRPFTPPYDRPALAMFDAHCDTLIAREGLDAVRIRGVAQAISAVQGGYRVQTPAGEIVTRRIVLALGLGEQPLWPGWALTAQAFGARVDHVFEPGFSPDQVSDGPVLVVGGGISGGQLAASLATAGREVRLWMRHGLRVHQFDSDPGWIGPRYMAGFAREESVPKRREMIAAARHRGSMPLDVADDLGTHIKAGRVTLIGGDFEAADAVAKGGLVLRTSTGSWGAAHTVLCTGFAPTRPGGALVDGLVADLGLRCAGCGYPIADATLQWRPGLFVMGPLAELELGPTARNITGARAGAERIARAA